MLLRRCLAWAPACFLMGCSKSGLFGLGAQPDGIAPNVLPLADLSNGGDAGPPPSACVEDAECATEDMCITARCVEGTCDYELLTCDDGDPCTLDGCSPEEGCFHDSMARDEDEDGYFGPLAGFAPGEPGSCGDDCDDTSAHAYPGNGEVCDGLDNDCNGVVDDGATYVPATSSPRLLSPGTTQASLGGFAYNGQTYAATGAYEGQRWSNSFMTFDQSGSFVVEPRAISEVNNDTFSGPLVWTGSVFATAWEDRRNDDYEIYFNRIDVDGNRLGPDLRVTNAPEMSTRADVLWDGNGYVLVWNDRRDHPDYYRLYGQRVSAEGELVGGSVPLTAIDLDAQGPSVTEGDAGLGVVFNYGELDARRVGFLAVKHDFSDPGPVVTLSSEDSVGASLVYNDGRFVSAWSKRDRFPGDAIYGVAISQTGDILIPEKRLTESADFARSHSILALGDRFLLLWAEKRGDDPYVVYSKELDLDLDELTPPRQVTFATGDAFAPAARFGPDGDVGVVYTDATNGAFQLYFTRLVCEAGFVLR